MAGKKKKTVKPTFAEATDHRDYAEEGRLYSEGCTAELEGDESSRRGSSYRPMSEGDAWAWAAKHDASTLAGL